MTNPQDSRSVVNLGSLECPIPKQAQGSPADFEEFLPWAAKKLQFHYLISVSKRLLEPPPPIMSTRKTVYRKNIYGKSTSREDHVHKNIISDHAVDKQDSKSVDNNDVSHEKVSIIAVYEKNDLVQILIENQKHVYRNLLQVIRLIAEFFPRLRRITINGGINETSNYELNRLIRYSSITEVFLDDTAVKQANYDVLLEDPLTLQVLSLARCKLEDDVVKRIADKLHYPTIASQTLCMLNLSTNFLTNKSAKYLAAALRTNRKLSYLNLAGNKISDEGGIAILNVLTSFPLTSDEIREYRRRYMDFLIKQQEFIKSYIETHRDATSIVKLVKRKAATCHKKGDANLSNAILKTMEGTLKERALIMADKSIGSFTDPFSDSTIIDRWRHSNGNSSLVNLNLAYNNLTYPFLKKLLKVVQYQQSTYSRIKGLKSVKLDGNLLPVGCQELIQLNIMFERNVRCSIIKTFSKK